LSGTYLVSIGVIIVVGLIMASYMYRIVVQESQKFAKKANFVVVTIDEVTIVNNESYLFVHCYVGCNWVRVPLLVVL